jgi:prephenate dehydratase
MPSEMPNLKENTGFLGPTGSYTELALNTFVKPKDTTACHSIQEVFLRLSKGEISSGFVPIENMLQGPVTETLDLLYQYRDTVQIEASYTFRIAHCFGRLESGKSSPEIASVHSKDIALRQCSQFLAKNFPNAEMIPAASTTAAAAKIKKNKILDAGVIGPEETLKQLGFRIEHTNIADNSNNQTRFILLSRGPFSLDSSKNSGALVTSIVVDPGRDRQGLLFEILEVISVKHKCNLNSIHSRPDGNGGFVFHLDLEGGSHEPAVRACLEELQNYCDQTTGQTAEISVFGSYVQTPFIMNTFTSIGIVGGLGVMGKWFTEFFKKAGLEVHVHDRNAGNEKGLLSLEELCKNSEVILLSIPMSAVTEVVDELCKYLKPHHLVVENCSIKSAALPYLLEKTKTDIEILGLHTMFGGDVEQVRGQNVIVTRTSRQGEKSRALEDLIYKHGAITTLVDLETHDHASAVLQAALQCTLVCLGDFISQNFSSLDNLDTFSTPNSRAVIDTIKRILRQTDELLLNLQELNPQSHKARLNMLQSIFCTMTAIENGDLDSYRKALERSREFFKT